MKLQSKILDILPYIAHLLFKMYSKFQFKHFHTLICRNSNRDYKDYPMDWILCLSQNCIRTESLKVLKYKPVRCDMRMPSLAKLIVTVSWKAWDILFHYLKHSNKCCLLKRFALNGELNCKTVWLKTLHSGFKQILKILASCCCMCYISYHVFNT